MNARTTALRILCALLLSLIASSVVLAVGRAQCDPATGACGTGGGDGEKKKRSTATPLPTATPTLTPTSTSSPPDTAPLAEGGLPGAGASDSWSPNASSPAGDAPLGLLGIGGIISVLLIGGILFRRRALGGAVDDEIGLQTGLTQGRVAGHGTAGPWAENGSVDGDGVELSPNHVSSINHGAQLGGATTGGGGSPESAAPSGSKTPSGPPDST